MSSRRFGAWLVMVFVICAVAPACRAAPPDTVTFHTDNLRTGWNNAETALTPASIVSGHFGLQTQVALDEQVDAQPLFLAGQTIANQGVHDVLYVATENNSIYALDAATGAVLLQTNLGTPVPQAALPGQCDNNSVVVGVNSTPVIDRTAGLMYLIAYSWENSAPVFRLHALDLTTLQDKLPSVVVGATTPSKRKNVPLDFSPVASRQRPALLETSGNIYAAFGSWCDGFANLSRGWVLGWNAATLAPLPAAFVSNKRTNAPHDFFLSSIWMSGDGVASDDAGNLFFTTGNSDYSANTYNSVSNLSESVVKLSADLTTIEDFYTPNGGPNGWRELDKQDDDFASGGVLLLPPQQGTSSSLAVAAGKAGPMYLLDRNHMGGLGKSNATLGSYVNDGCWCGQSYFTGADGIGRVVESTGAVVRVWKVVTSPNHPPKLSLESTSGPVVTLTYAGFFTSVSSNGTQPGSAIVWALGRPESTAPGEIILYAFDPSSGLAPLYTSVAGNWPYPDATSNLVPVIGNGRVYVASYKTLVIYGFGAGSSPPRSVRVPPHPPAFRPTDAPHALHGIVTAIQGDSITLRLRNGKDVVVDTAPARKAFLRAQPAVGEGTQVRGDWRGTSLFSATVVLHARRSKAFWDTDF